MQKSSVRKQDGVILVENGVAVTVGQTLSGGFVDYLRVKGKTTRLRGDSNISSDSLDSSQTLGLGVVNSVGNYAGTGLYEY